MSTATAALDDGVAYVIANGFVYVSTANVYAVGVASHAQAWSAAVGGWRSIASGQLLVASPDGTLHGFALTGPDGWG
jgi:hypothetical protein